MSNNTDGCIREIDNAFSGLFKEIFNVVEVGLDKEKAIPAKSLIGNKIDIVKVQCYQAIYRWFDDKTGGTDNPPIG